MAFSRTQLTYIDAVKRNLRGTKAWLVGGALRDMLLERPINDMDFVITGDTRRVAQAVAMCLGGKVFVLDRERDTHRVILKTESGDEYFLDFIKQNGDTLQNDLMARDYTINAMAVDLTDLDHLIDPMDGLSDLRAKRLRACSTEALTADPVRCLRGLRLANTLGFQIEKNTITLIREAFPQIIRSAPERIRDELFKIFSGAQASRAIRVLDTLGGIDCLFPELLALTKTEQTAPHQLNAWEHSLATLTSLEDLISILTQAPDREGKGNWLMSMISMHLGIYREKIKKYFEEELTPPRTRRGLLFFVALYHDVGKPDTISIDEEEKHHFYRHERVGLPLIVQRGMDLALSRDECEWLGLVLRYHMHIHHYASQGSDPKARTIYRFFKIVGEAGIAVSLLSLADLIATYGTTITREILERELTICRHLLATWWERPNDILDQPILINGDGLMKSLKIPSSPLVGELLEAIRLGQVDGRVKTRKEGLELAKVLMNEKHIGVHRDP